MKNRNGIVIVLALIIVLFLWHLVSKGDSQPSGAVQGAIFQNTYLVNSDGDRIYSYCFGLGGGGERSHPCVYIVNFQSAGTNDKSESCFDVSYIAEANYGATSEEIPSNRRYFPYESAPFDFNVCGKFEPVFGQSKPNGKVAEDWKFVTDTFPSAFISADLKSKGYVW